MSFLSMSFLLFFSVALPLMRLLRGRSRVVVLCVLNFAFYACWDWRLLAVLFGVCWFCFELGKLVDAASPVRRKVLVKIGVIVCLLVLGVFKYANFFCSSFCALLEAMGMHTSSFTLKILLPMGISFYVFRGISYIIDVSRSALSAERSFLRFGAYFAFFPQLLAGPIVRASEFLPQLDYAPADDMDKDILVGLNMFAWGALMKVALADTLSYVVAMKYEAYQTISSIDALTGSFFYTWQIYGDFCGYSLMSLGVARVMGFRFGDNFRRPYFSTSFQEFWRRWHISLSTWLRDYLYIPLGGSRNGHTYRNLFLTMLLGGAWHGASWTFVAWGAGHGALLCFERLYLKYLNGSWLVRILHGAFVFLMVMALWIFFRADSFGQAIIVLSKSAQCLFAGRLGMPELIFEVIKGLIVIVFVFIGDMCAARFDLIHRYGKSITASAIFCAFCMSVILFFGSFKGNSFIYQNF